MPQQQFDVDSWADVAWPDWVPLEVADDVQRFWTPGWGRSPREYVRATYDDPYNAHPDFGERVVMRTLVGDEVEGRYVAAWNNIGRIVTDEGKVHVVSVGRRGARAAAGVPIATAVRVAGRALRPDEVLAATSDEGSVHLTAKAAVPPAEQPAPVPNDNPAVWDLVIADMRARDHVGRARYGTPLQAGNGRDALRDAYEEALDLAVYLRQEIEEREARRRRG